MHALTQWVYELLIVMADMVCLPVITFTDEDEECHDIEIGCCGSLAECVLSAFP